MPPFLLGVKKNVLTQHPGKVFMYFVSQGANHIDLCLKVDKRFNHKSFHHDKSFITMYGDGC